MTDDSIERIGHWLLHGGPQIRLGPAAGAVAGWLDHTGSPAFAYPEITGYYLTCMAFMKEVGVADPAVKRNANLAVVWLHKIFCEGGPVQTRYYRDPATVDWRNDAMFSFDLAMILRGLAGVDGLVDEVFRRETFCAVRRKLQNFISKDGYLLPCTRLTAGSLPYRWSTRFGPFQLKAAAALLACGLAQNEGLAEACLRTFERWQTPFSVCTDDMHATLYAVEGLILRALYSDGSAWAHAVRQYELCLKGHTPLRSDVEAQLLRIGCILRTRGLLDNTKWDGILEGLHATIISFVSEGGSVCSVRTEDPELLNENIWSAIFAYQAVTYFHNGSSLAANAWRLLC
jgi:hypothetical protein